MSDSITILRCARGLRLSKLIRPNEIVTYDSTRIYDAWSEPLVCLDDIEQLIRRTIDQPRLCIVRGELATSGYVRGIRRLLYPDPKTGDAATLVDAPRRWCGLDVEGVQRQSNIDPADLPACAEDALRHFPYAFRKTACIVQATAGHGIKPDHRLRLWYWLSRPTTGKELQFWLRRSPADPALFRAAQVCYTAAPIFEGMADHLPDRIDTLSGDAEVIVPDVTALTPKPRAEQSMPEPTAYGASEYARAVLRNAATRVSRAPVNRRHPTCVSQSQNLSRFVAAGLLSASDVKAAMGEALRQTGKEKEEGEAIAAWAIAHAGGGHQ